MALIPGSLNVHLTAKFDWNDSRIEPFKKIYSLAPYGGNRDICLIPCEIYSEEKIKFMGTHGLQQMRQMTLTIKFLKLSLQLGCEMSCR
jgi:hypothetical protein